MCDGKTVVAGKRKPVALVAMVISRNRPVSQARSLPLNSAVVNATPSTSATTLISTCKVVKADSDIPRIMRAPVFPRNVSITVKLGINIP